MTKVKICGITNLEDALLSAKFGADALGFNFYEKSPRYIAPEKAAEIIKELPENVLKVGVFVNETLEKIAEIAEIAGLDALQLHGEETPEFARELKQKTNLEIIKAFRVSPDFVPEDVLKYETDAILLDAYSPKEHGGTGETFDWEIAKKVQKIFPKMYLAGGLSCKNVAKAILEVNPLALDVCSGIEQNKDKKDENSLMKLFGKIMLLGQKLVNHSDDLDLFCHLDLFRKRPKLYLQEKSLFHLCSFIIGYLSALKSSDIEFRQIDYLFKEFDKFAGIQRGMFLTSYYKYANHFLEKSQNHQENAFDLFYIKLEKFKLIHEDL